LGRSMGGAGAGKRLLAGSQPLAGLDPPPPEGGVGSALRKALAATARQRRGLWDEGRGVVDDPGRAPALGIGSGFREGVPEHGRRPRRGGAKGGRSQRRASRGFSGGPLRNTRMAVLSR